MAKILHTADLHLGARLPGLGRSGDRVRSALKSALTAIIDLAIHEKVDAVIIAGDLFDSNQVSSSLIRFALGEIARLKGIPCLVLPGTHDCLEEGSVLMSFDHHDKPDNLSVFLDPENPVIRLKDRELTFYGLPNLSSRSTKNPVASVRREEHDGKHVLLAHGSFVIPGKTAPDDHPFTADDIDKSGFDYVALGHWHSLFELPTTRTKAAYCGSPERKAFDQTGAGHVLIVGIDNQVTIEKREVGKTRWRELELSSANFRYTIEIEQELQKYVGDNQLLRAYITGLTSSDSNVNIDEIYDQLADSFLYLSIIDKRESVPKDLLDLKLPATTILGQFIRQVSAAIEESEDPGKKELLTESLRTGYALLSGKDVL
jgi:DNA repair exonuclease SbcCD nuclease subunit